MISAEEITIEKKYLFNANNVVSKSVSFFYLSIFFSDRLFDFKIRIFRSKGTLFLVDSRLHVNLIHFLKKN